MSVDINISDFFKLPNKIFAALALTTGAVLFLPEKYIEKIYLSSLKSSFGSILGIVFVISLSILIISLVMSLYQVINHRRRSRIVIQRGKRLLETMNNYQKEIVTTLYRQKNYTFNLPVNDGAVQQLEQSLIIGKATNQYPVDLQNPKFPYFLQPWAIDYIKDHPDLL